MRAATAPRVLLCANESAAVEDVRRLLDSARCQVVWHPIGASDPDNADLHLALIDGGKGNGEALRFCRRLRGRLGDAFVPVLYLTGDASPAARLAPFEVGADTYLLRPFAPGELLAQVRAFLRIKEVHDRLSEKTAEVHRINRRLQQAYGQIDAELELARRIQLSFLPQSLPEVAGARFAVHYRLCGRVGGDFYDLFRLDENHVGLYVADAMGHGVPASLLTIFVKKGVRAKEVFGQQYRLVPPGEVLGRLNHDLVEQAMADHPFITMVYVVYNHCEQSLSFARAGHPYPVYVPREGEPRLWQVEGSLLGVFETTFPVQSQRVRAGDKVVLYSDGIDGACFEGRAPGSESLLACAARHRELPIQEFVAALARDLFGQGSQTDDLTLLGLEVLEQ
ncbi:MAG TPA: SpoIIE family protein phosphatase [Gemmataceae bacterium]|nr:SpoIIE family protein phosphatase [Gemmataceae bacterium]